MPRFGLLIVLAVVVFMLSAMLRQYREVTIPATVLLLALAGFAYFREKRTAG